MKDETEPCPTCGTTNEVLEACELPRREEWMQRCAACMPRWNHDRRMLFVPEEAWQ